MLDREVRIENAGCWTQAVIHHIFPGVSNHLLYMAFPILTDV